MAKDPAILWYWGDWVGGTMTLSRHLKGCYIDLLCAQFNNGPLSTDEIKTVLGTDFGSAWPAIQKKFERDESGRFFNRRLQEEKDKRMRYSESRRLNRIHMNNHMYEHMDNENENKNENKERKGNVSHGTPLAEEFLSLIKKNSAYKHIDIEKELLKMDAWLLANPGRKKTKRFVVNWLNKIDIPIAPQKPAEKTYKPNPACQACGGTGKLPDDKKCWCWSLA